MPDTPIDTEVLVAKCDLQRKSIDRLLKRIDRYGTAIAGMLEAWDEAQPDQQLPIYRDAIAVLQKLREESEALDDIRNLPVPTPAEAEVLENLAPIRLTPGTKPPLAGPLIYWECQCGADGAFTQPKDTSLASLVRTARLVHEAVRPCGDPDIVCIEDEHQHEVRARREPLVHADIY